MKPVLERRYAEHKTTAAYEKVAWFYDFWSRLTESRSASEVVRLADVREGETILEVAVGTGDVFEMLVRLNTTGFSEGIDVSPSMLQRATQKMKKYPSDRYRLQAGSAYALPFDAGTFDLVVNNFMLDLLPERDFVPLLSEFRRVLKPGGRMVISTMTFGRRWYNKQWDWIARYLPSLLTGCRPVAMSGPLMEAGFDSITSVYVSQNTFPAEVLRARSAAQRPSS